jgi:molecular chaperone GrpE
MADDKNPDGRIEPTFDSDPQTNRERPNRDSDESQDQGFGDDMMRSFDTAFGTGPVDTNVEDELRAEIAQLKDQVLRSLAEVENVRRRVEREKQDMAKYAVANFAKAILPVADNLERALASVTPEARAQDPALENLCVGLELTYNELKAANEKFGVKQIEAMGKRLDPNLHQAVFEVEDPSVPAGTVVQVMQPGYTIHDRLLRPAMVGVAKGGPKEAPAPAAPAANENPGPVSPDASGASNAYTRADQSGDGGKKFDTEL